MANQNITVKDATKVQKVFDVFHNFTKEQFAFNNAIMEVEDYLNDKQKQEFAKYIDDLYNLGFCLEGFLRLEVFPNFIEGKVVRNRRNKELLKLQC